MTWPIAPAEVELSAFKVKCVPRPPLAVAEERGKDATHERTGAQEQQTRHAWSVVMQRDQDCPISEEIPSGSLHLFFATDLRKPV